MTIKELYETYYGWQDVELYENYTNDKPIIDTIIAHHKVNFSKSYTFPFSETKICYYGITNLKITGHNIKQIRLQIGGSLIEESNEPFIQEIDLLSNGNILPLLKHHHICISVICDNEVSIEYELVKIKNPSENYSFWFNQTQMIINTITTERKIRVPFNHPLKYLIAILPENTTEVYLYCNENKSLPFVKKDNKWICSFENLTVNFSRIDLAQIVFKSNSTEQFKFYCIGIGLQFLQIKNGMAGTKYSK